MQLISADDSLDTGQPGGSSLFVVVELRFNFVVWRGGKKLFTCWKQEKAAIHTPFIHVYTEI